MTDTPDSENRAEEQAQLAREIGEEITDAFIAYVRGDVAFDDLTFGVFDALSDLHIIAGGDYVLDDAAEGDHEHEHEHDHDHHHDQEEHEH